MSCSMKSFRQVCFAAATLLASTLAEGATVQEALQYVPVQREVEYDRPSAKEVKDCTIDSEKIGKTSAWIVRGGGGQVLRVFGDTNSDNSVDQWSYFQNGIEVYRDIDSNYDGKADQYRWFGLAGTRWGIDKNQDGQIDYWKAISAEEVTAEVLSAMSRRDASQFARVLLTSEELARLGLGKESAQQIGQQIKSAPQRFKSLVAKQREVDQRTKWIHFGATRPGVLPAGSSGSTRDLTVYENVSAMVETAGKHGQIPIGSLVRVGEVWRMVDVPTVMLDEEQRLAAGYFFQPSLNKVPEPPTPPEGAISEEMRELVGQLDALEKDLASAKTPATRGKAYEQQAGILREMASKAKTQKDQTIWIRQLADTLSAGAQSGDYPAGIEKLNELHGELARQSKKSNLTGYVLFRMMTSEYSMALNDPKADLAKIQEDRVVQLKDFIENYPESADAAEAMLQVAIAEEFAGNEEDALQWYDEILKSKGDELVTRKAQGARRRLTGVGKPLVMEGPTTDGRKLNLGQLRGRLVLLHYWATWCEPCKDDIKKLDKLVAEYGGKKFMPVGINVDTDDQSLSDFLRRNRLNWPQLHEKGGLDSRLAVDLGILTVPTMILIDEKGNVVDRDILISEVETYLSKNLK